MTRHRRFSPVLWLLLLLPLAAGCARQDVSPVGSPEPGEKMVQTPPAATPAVAARPNNLARALQNWVLEYPVGQGQQWVFSERTKKSETHAVEVGKPCHLKDVTEFDAQVTANGKWGVQFEYQGQVKKFSLVE